MKFLILLTIVSVAVAQEHDETEHQDLDIESIVGNEETLKAYNDCFIDAGPCDDDMAQIKDILQEAVMQACSKCSDAQKNIMFRYSIELQKKLPEEFLQFKTKYDPEDKYFEALIDAVSPVE